MALVLHIGLDFLPNRAFDRMFPFSGHIFFFIVPFNYMTIKDKVIALLSSIRFLQLVVVAVIQALVLFSVISTDQGTGLANIISALLVGSVGLGTIDRFSAAKATTTTVTIPSGVSNVTASTAVQKISKTTGTKKK